MKYIFPDTNIFLHFKFFDEIDWQMIIDGSITMVIAPIVISELDHHKRNPNSRISKRAKSVLKKLEDYGDLGQINQNAAIKLIAQEPAPQVFEKSSLDKTVPDDRLIAGIQKQ